MFFLDGILSSIKNLQEESMPFLNEHFNMALLPKFWRSTVNSIMQGRISSAICKGLAIVFYYTTC